MMHDNFCLRKTGNIKNDLKPRLPMGAIYDGKFLFISFIIKLSGLFWSFAMSVAEIEAESPLVFTSGAAAKVAALIEEEGNPDLMLRIYIQGGGCSGFQYGFTFDEDEKEGDTKVITDGVTLLVDPMSLQYLTGAEVDYTENLQGSQFVIRNPNASTTCGCGSSFSV